MALVMVSIFKLLIKPKPIETIMKEIKVSSLTHKIKIIKHKMANRVRTNGIEFSFISKISNSNLNMI